MPRTRTSDLAARVVGEEIRRARTAAGPTQAEVAARLDLSTPYVSNVEAGRVNLTVEGEEACRPPRRGRTGAKTRGR